MTPEQEILADALVAVRQRTDRFAEELKDHAAILPLDPNRDWSEVSSELDTHVTAFIKRFEMTQDQITRKLFRSVLAVKGTTLRTGALADVVLAMARLGVVRDAPHWEEITKLRNVFAHDYMLTFAELVPKVNEAWNYSPDLIEMVGHVEQFVADHRLLAEQEKSS